MLLAVVFVLTTQFSYVTPTTSFGRLTSEGTFVTSNPLEKDNPAHPLHRNLALVFVKPHAVTKKLVDFVKVISLGFRLKVTSNR